MPAGGYRPGSGRKHGSRNQKTQDFLDQVQQSGITPLDFLLNAMRNPAIDMDQRLDAAKSAAPYVHAKLASFEHHGPNGGPLQIAIINYDTDNNPV